MLYNKRMTKRLHEFEDRKGIHVTLNASSHSEFRIQCFKHKLSMQEVLEEFIVRVANEDQEALSLLVELKKDKRNKTVKKLKSTDVDSIYDMINAGNPLSDD
jgi:hypothetical protein